MKLSEAVSIYIKMRDKKAQMKAEIDASVAPLNEKMEKLEAKLLDVFNKTGIDSVKTEFGTAYTTTRVTASVADREIFMTHVRENDDWALLEVRASKTAVEQYRETNNDLPPGVSTREERVVNVRRSS
jgi:phage host-nuclease inhibitor protein Gam